MRSAISRTSIASTIYRNDPHKTEGRTSQQPLETNHQVRGSAAPG